jgi:hypothetical protein
VTPGGEGRDDERGGDAVDSERERGVDGRDPDAELVSPSPASDAAAEVVALRRLSHALDELFVVPGTSYRVGLDPLLGLVPGVGDVAASTASAYIVARAAALGVPRATLARMVVVLVVDAVFGSLPVVGDVFDATWKANARNVRLLEARLDDPGAEVRDRRYVVVVALGLAAVLVLVGAATLVGIWWLLGRVGVV